MLKISPFVKKVSAHFQKNGKTQKVNLKKKVWLNRNIE